LVAALVPRVLADPDDGGLLYGGGSFFGPSGEVTGGEDSGVLTQTGSEQAQTDPDTQPPTNADGGAGGAGDATLPLQAQSDQEHSQPPPDVAQAQQDQPPDAQAAGVPERDDQAGQGGQRDAVAGCASGGCSTRPPTAGDGDPTVAAAGTLRGLISDLRARAKKTLGWGEPQEAPLLPVLDQAEEVIRSMEDRQRALDAEGGARGTDENIDDSVLTRRAQEWMREALSLPGLGRGESRRLRELSARIAAIDERLVDERLRLLGENDSLGTAEHAIRQVEISQRLRTKEGRTPSEIERSSEQQDLEKAIAELNRPRSQADMAVEAPGRRADLTARVERAKHVLDGESAMSMVRPEEVGLGQPTTKGSGSIPALPSSASQPPPGQSGGYRPLSPGDLNPSSPGLRPPKVDTGLDGYPAVNPLPNMTHQRSGEASQTVTSSQATSSSAEEAITTAAPGLGMAAGGLGFWWAVWRKLSEPGGPLSTGALRPLVGGGGPGVDPSRLGQVVYPTW
jgi:hypothetical protein